jgi:ribonucleoside-diphosphate reductase alpha chain
VAVQTESKAIPQETVQAFGGDELRARVFWEKYAMEGETRPEQMWDRVAREIASVEPDDSRREHWQREFRWLLDGFRFLPGGRIMHGAGNPSKITLLNCYFCAIRGDNIEAIYDAACRAARTYSRGGGVGIDITPLRPRGAPVHNAAKTSTGAVSFMELFSLTTGLIGQCLAGGTPVLTSAGWRPVETISRGDHVWTHRGWRQVTHVFSPQLRDTYKLRTRRGYTLTLSADHKLAVAIGDRIALIPLRDLKPGDRVLLLRGRGAPDASQPGLRRIEYTRSPYNGSNRLQDIRQPECIDTELAYWLGFYFGNGSTTLRQGRTGDLKEANTCITVRGGREPTVRRLCRILHDSFGLRPRVQHRAGEDCVRIRVSSKLLYLWLRENGLLKPPAHEVAIPELIRRCSDDVLAAFLAGLFDADGSPRGSKSGYRFSTTSPHLAEHLRLELLRLGVITVTHLEADRPDGWNPLYQLSVVGRSAQQAFLETVGRYSDRVDGFLAKRDSCITPWTARALGINYNRFSYVASPPQKLSAAVLERYAAEADTDASQAALLVEDTIESITHAGPCLTYDIEVEDTHKFSAAGLYVSNSGRRGALMITIADHHPDVLDFCRIKRDLTSVRYANISVRLSDAFMRAVERDEPWTLRFEGPEVGRIERTIRARDLWKELVEGARDWAEPGCLFWDRVIGWGTSNYGGMTPQGTNPCVTGDTRVATSQGLVRIDDLATAYPQATGAVLDSRVCAAGGIILRAWKTGRRPVLRVETREGYSVRCTPDHKVLTENRGWVMASELQPGDLLLVQDRKGGFGRRGTYELGLSLGWLTADGTVNSRYHTATLSFYGAKRALAPIFQQAVASSISEVRGKLTPAVIQVPYRDLSEIRSRRLLARLIEEGFDPSNKHQVPELIWQGSEDTVRGFLQALFTADGTVLNNSASRRSIRLTNTSLELLRSVQVLLANFGIFSKIYTNRRAAGPRLMPDGRGGQRPYECKAVHELVIAGSSISNFMQEIGFIPGSDKQRVAEAMLSEYSRGPYRNRHVARVLRVVPDGEEDVYDLHEPTSGTFIANGITVHNCSEIPLEDGGACDLGSLNLSRFVLDPFTPQARIDSDSLRRAVRAGVRFLDNVLTYNEGKHPLPEQEEAARRGRRIGLGITGLGDALVMLGLRYDSDEAIRTAGELQEFIKLQAYRASMELAREKGPFPAFDPEKHLSQAFFSTFPDYLLQEIRRHGLRNVSLLTIPPVGSGSALAGCTNGLESIFALYYLRRSESLSREYYTVLHPLVAEYSRLNGLDLNGLQDTSDPHGYLKSRLPAHFVTAHEIDPIKRVDMQAALQRHIDQSISSTVNLPREATAETVERVYFHAWRADLKGISVYREGSREGVLLTPEEARRRHQLVALADRVDSLARSAIPDLPRDGDAGPEQRIEATVRALADALEAVRKQAPEQLELISDDAGLLRDRPRRLDGPTYRVPTQFGTLFVTVTERDQEPYEVFVRLGKAGSDTEAFAEAVGRLSSVILRMKGPGSGSRRLLEIVHQLEGIGGRTSFGFGPNRIRSVPDAIAAGLRAYLQDRGLLHNSNGPAEEETATHVLQPVSHNQTRGAAGDLCPRCHEMALLTDNGCTKCAACGYREC